MARPGPSGTSAVGRVAEMQTQLPSGTAAELVEKEGSARGLVIIPDIWGLRPLFSELSQTLADRTSWTTVCFEPFPGQDLPGSDAPDGMARRAEALASLKDTDILADAVAAAELTGCAEVSIIGFCMGGMYALKASSTGRFATVVSFYGMAHVPEAWASDDQGDPIELLGRRGDTAVMQIAGTEDHFLPESDLLELEAAGVTVRRYEGAEHGFLHDPSRPAHRADYAEDAWARAITFLAGES